jgi:hypothetical protein
VATAPLGDEEIQDLRAALADTGTAPGLAAARATLLLSGFAVPRESDYVALDDALAASRRFSATW